VAVFAGIRRARRPESAGRGRRASCRPLGLHSGARLWRGRGGEVGRRRPGAVAATACCAGEVELCGERWARRRARVGARDGGGELGLVCSRPEPVARRGGLRWRARVESGGAAWRDAEGQRPLYGGLRACPRLMVRRRRF
jgi:hypothetical protein